MPGPFNSPFKPPSCSRSPKPPYKKLKPSMASIKNSLAEKTEDRKPALAPTHRKPAVAVSPSDSSLKNVRVRVICTDPCATDSSSDDDEEEEAIKHCCDTASTKRVVRELMLPPSFSFSPPTHKNGVCTMVKHSDMRLTKERKRSNADGSSTSPCVSKCRKYMGVAEGITNAAPSIQLREDTIGSLGYSDGSYSDAVVDIYGQEAWTNHVSQSDSSEHDMWNSSCVTQDVNESLDDSILSVDPQIRSLARTESELSSSCASASSAVFEKGDLRLPVNSSSSDSSSFLCIPYDTLSNQGVLDIFGAEYGPVPGFNGAKSKFGDAFFLVSKPMVTLDHTKAKVNNEDGGCEPCIESSMPSFPFMESISYFDEFGKILVNGGLGMAEVPELRVQFDNFFEEKNDLVDMNVELDPEALTWIDVPDSWQCV